MATPSAVKRGLLCRVSGLSGVWAEDGQVPVIHLIPERDADHAKLIADARAALREIVPAGVLVNVQIATGAIPTNSDALRGVHSFAALASDPTRQGLMEGVLKLVPAIGRLVIEEGLGVVRFLVSDATGECSQELLKSVSDAVRALASIGIAYEVAALPSDDMRDDLRRPGFFVPTRTPRLTVHREEDEHRFERRLRALVDDGACERIPLVDDLDGTKIFSTIGLNNGAPIGAFLPMYDRVYVMMSPGNSERRDDYYTTEYGLTEAHFLDYVRAKKIVPIFKFELGVYPENVWKVFAEDLSLPYITARDMDYASARYAWSSAEWVRILREDRDASRALFEALRRIDSNSAEGRSVEGRAVASLLRFMIDGASSFEGMLWRRGHLSAGHYSPAMPLAKLVHSSTPFNSRSMAPIDVEGAAMHLSMGLALGATTYEGMVTNEALLEAVAKCFGADPADTISASKGGLMRDVLDALELSYSVDIPPDEYMAIVDEANGRRIRALVMRLLEGVDTDGKVTEVEVRERVQHLNDGVRRLTRKALPSADVSMVTTGVAKATGASWLATLLGGSIGARIGRSIDSTRAGDALDWMRGKLHGLPTEAVRLYRIRARLEHARRPSEPKQ